MVIIGNEESDGRVAQEYSVFINKYSLFTTQVDMQE